MKVNPNAQAPPPRPAEPVRRLEPPPREAEQVQKKAPEPTTKLKVGVKLDVQA